MTFTFETNIIMGVLEEKLVRTRIRDVSVMVKKLPSLIVNRLVIKSMYDVIIAVEFSII